MPALSPPDPPELGLVVTREQARAAGITDGRLRHLLASGRWESVAPGVYLRAELTGGSGPHDVRRARHRLEAEAAAARRSGSVIGLGSAAIVHGLPLVTGTPAVPHLLVPAGAWNGTRGGVRSHLARGLDVDVEPVISATGAELLVTTVARTWVDIARSQPLADALSVGDAALRAGAMTCADVEAVVSRLGRVRGCRQAVRALGLLDPLRESALESGSSARFIEWEFPVPRLQHAWYDEYGFITRSDFDWDEHELIGFADGMGKYGIDPARDRHERHQESRLRPLATVCRWGWPDVAGTGIGLFRLMAPLLRHERPFPTHPARW